MATNSQQPARDWISASLAPFRQSLRIYAEVQRSALETFSRFAALAAKPILSGVSDGDNASPAPKPENGQRRAPAPPAKTAARKTTGATKTAARKTTGATQTAARKTTGATKTAAKKSTTGTRKAPAKKAATKG